MPRKAIDDNVDRTGAVNDVTIPFPGQWQPTVAVGDVAIPFLALFFSRSSVASLAFSLPSLALPSPNIVSPSLPTPFLPLISASEILIHIISHQQTLLTSLLTNQDAEPILPVLISCSRHTCDVPTIKSSIICEPSPSLEQWNPIAAGSNG